MKRLINKEEPYFEQLFCQFKGRHANVSSFEKRRRFHVDPKVLYVWRNTHCFRSNIAEVSVVYIFCRQILYEVWPIPINLIKRPYHVNKKHKFLDKIRSFCPKNYFSNRSIFFSLQSTMKQNPFLPRKSF